MTRRKITNIIGATIALVGIAIAIGVNFYLHDIRWLPLNQPLLPSAAVAEFPFSINYSANYYIDVEGLRALKDESERTIQHRRLNCLLGLEGNFMVSHACDDTPRAIDFNWELLRDGNVMQRGAYATQLLGGWSGDAIDAQFADFHGRSGNYRLRLTDIRLADSLQRYTPHIRVQLQNDYYVGHAILGFESIVVGGVLFIFGLVVIAICEIVSRKSRKHSKNAAC